MAQSPPTIDRLYIGAEDFSGLEAIVAAGVDIKDFGIITRKDIRDISDGRSSFVELSLIDRFVLPDVLSQITESLKH